MVFLLGLPLIFFANKQCKTKYKLLTFCLAIGLAYAIKPFDIQLWSGKRYFLHYYSHKRDPNVVKSIELQKELKNIICKKDVKMQILQHYEVASVCSGTFDNDYRNVQKLHSFNQLAEHLRAMPEPDYIILHKGGTAFYTQEKFDTFLKQQANTYKTRYMEDRSETQFLLKNKKLSTNNKSYKIIFDKEEIVVFKKV